MATIETLNAATSTEGLRDPIDALLERRLRRATWDHTTSERRRHFLPLVHLGVPGGKEATVADRADQPTDQWLRADLIHAMRRRAAVAGPIVWLTRPGGLDLEDVDLRWLSAARQAFAEDPAPLVFVVVVRNAWVDPRSGLTRRWRRLRIRAD